MKAPFHDNRAERAGGTDAEPLYRCAGCGREGFFMRGFKAHVCRPTATPETGAQKGRLTPPDSKNSALETLGFSRVFAPDPKKNDPTTTLLPEPERNHEPKRTAMKKKPYEILGHGTRNPAKLTRHPEAETPIGQDELLALIESVRERGLIDPILVNDKDQVLDGCSRLEAALQAGLEEVPVTVVHCDDVRALASDSLIGRMRSKGQRVLAWVLKQSADATTAWDIRRQVPVNDSAKPSAVLDSAKKHYPELKPAEVNRLIDTYAPAAIAAKLGVSEDYAGSALQLVACLRLKLKVSTDATGKTRYNGMTGSKADQAYLDQLEQAVDNILRGDAQVTRWRAGLAGATATKDQRKAETNVPKVFMQASTSFVKTVFPAWTKLSAEERGDITENLRTGFAKSCPVELARELIDVLETVVAESAQG